MIRQPGAEPAPAQGQCQAFCAAGTEQQRAMLRLVRRFSGRSMLEILKPRVHTGSVPVAAPFKRMRTDE